MISCSGTQKNDPIILLNPEKIKFDNDNQRISYCIGLDHAGGSYSVYQSFETKDKFDINQIQSGMIDYLSGNDLRIPFSSKDSLFDLYLLPGGQVDENAVSKIDASYAIGMDEAYMLIGGLVGRGIDQTIDVDYLLMGINDAFEQKEPSVSYLQASSEIVSYYSDLNLISGQQFLSENEIRDSINTTESGLQYKIFSSGNGLTPNLTDTVIVHYTGRFLDGREFESTIPSQSPKQMTVLGFIQGLQEGLLLMKEGSEFRFFIPSSLAYGEKTYGAIEPNSLLIYDVELIKVLRFR